MRRPQQALSRLPRGKVLVLTGLVLPALIGLMALSTDVGIIGLGRAQMQVAADAGALAGAMKLVSEQRLKIIATNSISSLLTETAAAQAQAKKIAQANPVLNSTPVINDNATNSADGDVVIGHFDTTTRVWTPPPLPTSLAPFANAVQVTVTRSRDHGGLIPGFFSRLWNYTGTPVSVQSIALAQNYPIKGFKRVGNNSNGPNVNLLPIVLDNVTWQAMMASRTTDLYTYTESTRTVTNGSDGVHESLLFPVGSSPGNWGTIQIGTTVNSTSLISAQILYGITPTQMATYPNSTIQLDQTLTPPSIKFTGNPGISQTLESALRSIIGKPVVIPIYDQVIKQGANVSYRVINFQPCRIVNVTLSGNKNYVVVQPSYVKDGTTVLITDPGVWPTGWDWTQGGGVRLHLVK